MATEHNRDLWREGYERGMAEGAAYKEAYMKLLEQIANLQAMRPPEPMILRTQPAQVPTLTEQEVCDVCDGTLTTWSQHALARRVESALLKKMQGGGV